MKKTNIFLLIFFIFFFQHLSAQNYITAGLNIDLCFNCNEEVINEIGIIIPKPGVYVGFNIFKKILKSEFILMEIIMLCFLSDWVTIVIETVVERKLFDEIS